MHILFDGMLGTKVAGRAFSQHKNVFDIGEAMNEVHQLANALLTVIFAAAMFVVGHLYIGARSMSVPTISSAEAFVPWTSPLKNGGSQQSGSSILVWMHPQ